MIVGSVTPAGETVINLRLRGPHGDTLSLRAVIDTGFTDWLTLPPSEIARLELPFREETRFILADGSETILRAYSCEVEWLGEWRRTVVAAVEAGSLLEMGMLNGFQLRMDVIEDGQVSVEPLAVSGEGTS